MIDTTEAQPSAVAADLRDRLTTRVSAAIHTLANVESGNLPFSALDTAGLGHLAGLVHIPELRDPFARHFMVQAVRVVLIDRLSAAWAASVTNDRRVIALAGGIVLDRDGRWRITTVLHGRLTDINHEPATVGAALAAAELTALATIGGSR